MRADEIEIVWPYSSPATLYVLPITQRGLAMELLLDALSRALGSPVIDLDTLPEDERPAIGSCIGYPRRRGVRLDPALVPTMEVVRRMDRLQGLAHAMAPDWSECALLPNAPRDPARPFPCRANRHRGVVGALAHGARALSANAYEAALRVICDRVRSTIGGAL